MPLGPHDLAKLASEPRELRLANHFCDEFDSELTRAAEAGGWRGTSIAVSFEVGSGEFVATELQDRVKTLIEQQYLAQGWRSVKFEQTHVGHGGYDRESEYQLTLTA